MYGWEEERTEWVSFGVVDLRSGERFSKRFSTGEERKRTHLKLKQVEARDDLVLIAPRSLGFRLLRTTRVRDGEHEGDIASDAARLLDVLQCEKASAIMSKGDGQERGSPRESEGPQDSKNRWSSSLPLRKSSLTHLLSTRIRDDTWFLVGC